MTRAWPVALVVAACGSDASDRSAMQLAAISPDTLTARGGVVTVTGTGFEEGVRAYVRGDDVTVRFLDGGRLELVVPPMVAGPAPVRLERGSEDLLSEEGLTIEPILLRFVDAEPWRLPSVEGVTTLLQGPEGLVAGTAAGLATLSWTDGALVSEVTAPAEGELPVPVGRAVVLANGDRAVTCSVDGTKLGWATRTSSGFTAPQPVVMPEGASCGAMSALSSSTPELLVSLVIAGAPGLSLLRLGVDGPEWLAPVVPAVPGVVDVLRAVDVDGDGLDDLLLGGSFGARLWRGVAPSEGLPRFVDESAIAGRTARTFDLLALDLDRDGHRDLYFAGDGQDALYVNDGFGRFLDDAFRQLPFERTRGRSIASGDLDLDGHDDLVIATDDGPDRLFRSSEAGFVDETPALGLGAPARSRSALLRDLDGDGDLDLLTSDADGRLHVKFLVEPVEAP